MGQAGGGDLLDLPAARLRSADSRRSAAESGCAVCHRPCRSGGRRWPDPSRCLRPKKKRRTKTTQLQNTYEQQTIDYQVTMKWKNIKKETLLERSPKVQIRT